MANTNSLLLTAASGQYLYGSSTSYKITGSMTLEGWVKLNNTVNVQSLLNVWRGTNGFNMFNFRLVPDSDQTHLILSLLLSSDGNTGSEYKDPFIADKIPAHIWTHIAAAYDQSNAKVLLYINGVLGASFLNAVASLGGNYNQLQIGAEALTPINFADLYMDDVRFWNTLRSASDISNNYQRELAGNEPGLIAYFKFDNNYAESAGGLSFVVSGTPSFSPDVPFADNTTTSTSTSSTSTSTSTTTTSTSSSTTTSSSTSTSTTTTSTSTTTTSTTTTHTTTSTTITTTSTTTTSTSTTTTSTSTSTTTSTSTSTTITIGLRFMVEKVR